MAYEPPFCDPQTFVFALLWFNNEIYSPERPSEWLIHGLWPETCLECPTCGYPSYCPSGKPPFNETLLLPLSSKIKRRWYPGKHLLDHEWTKHGVCDGQVNETMYFETALMLWECLQLHDVKNTPSTGSTLLKMEKMCKHEISKGQCWIPLTVKDIEHCWASV